MQNYQKTKRACYMGFITQAIAANFAPLLFLKFHTDYHISLGNIALISTCFFFTQLLVDLFCARFVDKIGYRVCIVTSEISSALGLVGLAFLPELLPDPFMGIIISVIVYAVGSGLIEVLCSPIMEACPFKNKEATMSLLLWEPLQFPPCFSQFLEWTAGSGWQFCGQSFRQLMFTTLPPVPSNIWWMKGKA